MKMLKHPRVGIFCMAGGVIAVIFLAILVLASDKEKTTIITLEQDGATVSGDGAVVQDNVVTIMQGGKYQITGVLEDGQIYVNAGKKEEVELVLDGVTIANLSDAAIFIEKAGNTTILLQEGSENFLQSGVGEGNGSVEPGGEEEGAAGSSPDDKAEEEAGNEPGGAVIYAKGDLTVTGEGSLYIAAFLNNGVQSRGNLLLDGGKVTIDAAKHGAKGKKSLTFASGEYTLAVGNKGMLSDLELTVTGGKIHITKSKEGLEANQVTIENGYVEIVASDDGINANGGADKKKKHPSKDIVEAMPNLRMKGGEVRINAKGDGLDSNGNLLIEGGLVVIDGPVKDDDGPLDYGYENDGVCRVSGGTVLAIGSAGMAETFDEESSQCSFRVILEEPYHAGSEIIISDSGGREIYRHVAAKEGASVVFSSPVLSLGESYLLRVGERELEIVLESVSETFLESVAWEE